MTELNDPVEREAGKAGDGFREHAHGTTPQPACRRLNWYKTALVAGVLGAVGVAGYFVRDSYLSGKRAIEGNRQSINSLNSTLNQYGEKIGTIEKSVAKIGKDNEDYRTNLDGRLAGFETKLSEVSQKPVEVPTTPEAPAQPAQPVQAPILVPIPAPAPILVPNPQPEPQTPQKPKEPTFRERLAEIKKRYIEGTQEAATGFVLGTARKLKATGDAYQADTLRKYEETLTPDGRRVLDEAEKKLNDGLKPMEGE